MSLFEISGLISPLPAAFAASVTRLSNYTHLEHWLLGPWMIGKFWYRIDITYSPRIPHNEVGGLKRLRTIASMLSPAHFHKKRACARGFQRCTVWQDQFHRQQELRVRFCHNYRCKIFRQRGSFVARSLEMKFFRNFCWPLAALEMQAGSKPAPCGCIGWGCMY